MMGKKALYLLAAVFISISAPAAVLYVNLNSSNPTPPYVDWSTAAQSIQDAVNAANPGDEVLVTNGIYQTGQTYLDGSNRVSVTQAIALQSVNGPEVTVIRGYQVPGTTNGTSSIRCVYLGSGATLTGFTLTNGSAYSRPGGGVECQSSDSIVSNCVIVGNACANSAGGGGEQGAYDNCLIIGNTASLEGTGGGVAGACLTNCLIAGNVAMNGGGVSDGVFPLSLVNCTVVNNYASSTGGGVYLNKPIVQQFRNSIIFFNTAGYGNSVQYGTNVYNYAYASASNCCSPDFLYPTCTTNLPGLADIAHGNYHLQIGSPCIDAGDNDFVSAGVDLDGNPRIVNGTVDMGAYENQFTGVAHYVSLINRNPVSPFTNWLTAATNIQDAIDAANTGEPVVVSNGLYQTGGRVFYGTITNRVVIDKPISVQSLNGPGSTLIVGRSLVRCVYLTNNAALVGFTLTSGGTANSGDFYQNESGGGAWSESTNAFLVNCILTANFASRVGGGAYSGTLSNCVIEANNASYFGGGTASSTLNNCVISNNLCGFSGGGTWEGLLTGCTLVANHVIKAGGGASSNILINCTLTNNMATQGGGAFHCSLTGCVVSGNVSTNDGGGAYYCFLTNCALAGNICSDGNGGGSIYGALTDCLLTNNTASGGGGACSNMLYGCILNANAASFGGGSYAGSLTNCILIHNFASFGGGAAQGVCYACFMTNNSTAICSNIAINCIINSNLYGGAISSTLFGCVISLNSQEGAELSILSNCTIDHNYQYGIVNCLATNCIIYNNVQANWTYEVEPDGNLSLSYCCTTPLPSPDLGSGNFTNAPLFFSDGLHLQSNSPCIDAGYNGAVFDSTDIDGRPRIVNGTVDVGATEFQGAAFEPFIVWLDQYGLPDDGSADYADSDLTGMNNWQKWIAGLNPTNPASVLQMSALSNNAEGTTITWKSVSGITYFIQSSTNLEGQPAFSCIQSNVVGSAGTTSYTDISATNGGPYFYRVGVQ